MSQTRNVITMCPMNCHPTFCGQAVTIDDGRVSAISGDQTNPHSHGFLCVRGRATVDLRDNPQRLLTPMRRRGPRGSDTWEPISWEVAFNEIVGAIQATAPNRIGIWPGHGALVTGIARPLILRFGHLGGFQVWNPAIVCWAMGAFGLALTGVLETHTKEDLGEHANTILVWGANLASQPTTGPHLVAARRRGARVVLIDCRRSETASQADQVLLIRPGTDAALALALAQVIIAEGLTDPAFIAEHSIGYEEFARHVGSFTPEWAAPITGLEPQQIRELARLYATAKPAMILLGGSSLFKHRHGWEPARAIACLPALTGQYGIPGGGFGPRHRGLTRGDGMANPDGIELRRPGEYVPASMPAITAALEQGQLDVLLLLGSNIASSFANAAQVERGLARTGLIVAHEIFMSETTRRHADLVLPGTVWLEELGLKDTATHLHLMEQALPPAGEARSLIDVLRTLAERLALAQYFPWNSTEGYIDALLAPQHTDDGAPLTVERIRRAGGHWQRGRLSHVAYPDHHFHTPSGKIEFWSERAHQAGLSPLPSFNAPPWAEPEVADATALPLQLAQGRTLTHFHAFYDNGRMLPKLAGLNQAPELWINPADAGTRALADGDWLLMRNQQAELRARAHLTDAVPPGIVWLRDGWYGLNHLTSGEGVVTPAVSAIVAPAAPPGGQAAYDARVEVCAIR